MTPTNDIANRLAGLASTDAAISDDVREQLAARAEAEGLIDVAYTTTDSPVGPLLLATTAKGLVRLAYLSTTEEEPVLEELAGRISPRVLERPGRLDPVLHELDEYFAGKRRDFGLATDWRLIRPFATRVLRRTAAIPFGEYSTYRDVSVAIGSPRAARATGNALGSNPIPIVIPCHRVLRTGGSLGGYGGGIECKRSLLALEGVDPAAAGSGRAQ